MNNPTKTDIDQRLDLLVQRRAEFIRRNTIAIKELRALRDLLEHSDIRTVSDVVRVAPDVDRDQLIDATIALLRSDVRALDLDDIREFADDITMLEELLVAWRDSWHR